MPLHTAEITLTKDDASFFVWFREQAFPAHSTPIALADLFADKTTTEVNVTQNLMYVYVEFHFNQPGAKFSLKLGDKDIYTDEPAENHPQNGFPLAIDISELADD
jgi:hypothetical protein